MPNRANRKHLLLSPTPPHPQDVFNIFLGALFGGTVLAELRTFLENPSHIWSALGSAIPAASNFFM